ncbi:MAG: endolytic transglycosylase MltG [Gemmatimonadaceae bacterium]
MKWSAFLRCPLAAVVVWLVLAAGLTACGGDGPPQRVTVPPGASFRVATDSLVERGIVRYPRVFRAYAKFAQRDRSIRAGTYEFRAGQGWDEILASLAGGKSLSHTFTIPEGYSLVGIRGVVSESLDVPPESLDVAARDTALLRKLDVPTPTLEGYLFPDTYTFPPGATARDVVATMTARFEDQWQEEWNPLIQAMAMSRHDIVSLAAIIEKEARLPEERAVISAVYHNRLKIRMPLQADPTVQYALGKHVERVLYKDLEIDSRYNTYKYPGLPPGPIASPGAASLEAAVKPAQVPYLYFVAHPDGHHEFRRTFREHVQAIGQMKQARRALDAARPKGSNDSKDSKGAKKAR